MNMSETNDEVRPQITDFGVIGRFIADTKVKGTGSSCWIWKGYINTSGYGYIGLSEEQDRPVHRVAYRIFRDSIGENKHIHHTCGTRACVNPSHLKLMDPKEHLRLETERHPRHGHKRCDGLSVETVREIRLRYAHGEYQEDIADDLDISQSQVSRVVRGAAYEYID